MQLSVNFGKGSIAILHQEDMASLIRSTGPVHQLTAHTIERQAINIVNGLLSQQTYPSYTPSGQQIQFWEPNVKLLLSDWVAMASRKYRYSGAIPVNLLEHMDFCCTLFRYVSDDSIALKYLLIHDAPEFYLGEVPNGAKEGMPFYKLAEERWHRYIASKNDLPPTKNMNVVRWIDAAAVRREVIHHNHPAKDRILKETEVRMKDLIKTDIEPERIQIRRGLFTHMCEHQLAFDECTA